MEKYDTECLGNDNECLSRYWLISVFQYTLVNYNVIITVSELISRCQREKQSIINFSCGSSTESKHVQVINNLQIASYVRNNVPLAEVKLNKQ